MRNFVLSSLVCLFFISMAVPVASAQSEKQGNAPKSLIIYYSLSGNTRTVASILHGLVGGEIEEIKTVKPYPAAFEAVVEQAREERKTNFLPPIQELKINPQNFDIIYLGFPIWGNTIPQPMATFLSGNALAGKTIIPFCTHDGYGVGHAFQAIQQYCPNANVLPGFGMPGSGARNAKKLLIAWLDRLGMRYSDPADNNSGRISLSIKAGDVTVPASLYANETARAFAKLHPVTVSMSQYGGREYYAMLDPRISTNLDSKLNFEYADLTYCPQNNSIAIFSPKLIIRP